MVDPSLLTALNARVGDTLSLGEARFVITGVVTSAPNNVGIRTAFGPRVYIPARDLPATQLLGFGSRAEYEAFVRLPARVAPQAVAQRYRPVLAPERVRLRTVADDQRDMNEALSRLTGYLGLVGLIALLLGGIGVASAVVVFIRQRLDTIAVLRCLGATPGRVFGIYVLEAAAMGLGGSIAGAALGVLAQRLLPGLMAGLLPVQVEPVLSPRAVALGLGTGLWVALVFAAMPLLAVRRVPPLAALRRDVEPDRRRLDPWRIAAAAALAATTVALAALQVGSWRQGAIFSGGVAVALLVLWGASWALIRAARRWLPGGWPYVWRQGLANLHRPSNQTVTVVLAIGFGAFLLGTLFLVQFNLLRTLRVTGGPERPNLVLFDIQPDQLQTVQQTLAADGYRALGPVPIVPMRIQSIKGRPVRQSLADTTRGTDGDEGPRSGWALRREYRSTYRDSLVTSERLVAGRWFSAGARETQISVERDLARELGVGVGDEIVWDVQGVPLATRIASLREVDWARFEPNFFVVFAPGALEDAPQSLLTLTRVERAADRGALQRAHRRAGAERHQRGPVVAAGDARAADRPGRARHPLHGALHARHRDTGAGRGPRHQPVPAHPRGRAAPDARRHARAALPDRAVRVSVARRARGAGGTGARDGGGVGAGAIRVRRAVHPAAAPVRGARRGGRGAHGDRGAGQQPRSAPAAAARGAAGRASRRYVSGGSLITRFCSMLSIDLTGKRAFVAGVADDGGFGFAIAKALAEAGADDLRRAPGRPRSASSPSCSSAGRWTSRMRLADGRKLEFERIYPLDAGVRHARRRARRRSARTSATGTRATSRIAGLRERIAADFGDQALDIVVHSLANGPEVKKPLRRHQPQGLPLGAVGVSAYSQHVAGAAPRRR